MSVDFRSSFVRQDNNTFRLSVAHPGGQGLLQLKLSRKWISHWLCDHPVKGDGPWKELLGRAMANLLRRSRTPYKTADAQFEPAAEIMARELFRAFQFARIRAHECYSTAGDFKYATWEVVLPCGATAILRGQSTPDQFITAYFEKKARDKKNSPLRAADRWRRATVVLVGQIRSRLRQFDLGQIAALSLTIDSEDSGSREVRLNYQFLLPDHWGITWQENGPYFDETLIPDWPWAAPAAPVQPVIQLLPFVR
jgi:hypothetical protein